MWLSAPKDRRRPGAAVRSAPSAWTGLKLSVRRVSQWTLRHRLGRQCPRLLLNIVVLVGVLTAVGGHSLRAGSTATGQRRKARGRVMMIAEGEPPAANADRRLAQASARRSSACSTPGRSDRPGRRVRDGAALPRSLRAQGGKLGNQRATSGRCCACSTTADRRSAAVEGGRPHRLHPSGERAGEALEMVAQSRQPDDRDSAGQLQWSWQGYSRHARRCSR